MESIELVELTGFLILSAPSFEDQDNKNIIRSKLAQVRISECPKQPHIPLDLYFRAAMI